MKKRVIMGVIVAILVATIINHNNIYRFYKLNQIKNDCINNMNGKFNERTFPRTIKDYERYQKSLEELNHYDITKLIDVYIDILNNGVNLCILKKQGIEEDYIYKDYGFGHKIGLEYGKDIELDGSDFTEYISYDITDEDVDNYNSGTFKEKLIEKLKTCLDYVESNGNIEWQINSIEDKRIELPYNCYIDYTAYHREDNKEFKRAVDVILNKNFELGKNVNWVKIKYETPNEGIKEEKVELFCINKDNKVYYDIPLYHDLIVHADTIAKAKLGSHTVDKISEEESFRQYKEWEETMLN